MHAHVYVPDGYELALIPVDSACTVTNINHDSVIPCEHRMQATRDICVAKNVPATTPDYEGFGSINIITEFGSMKKLRMGRCIRAPSIKNLLSVGMLAKKGHECIMSENNPRIIMKDGTVVPMYFVDNLFLLPYLLPTSTHANDTYVHTIEEADALASAFSMEDDAKNSMPEEAVVHLAATAIPQNKIVIDTNISDRSGPLDEATKS